MIWFDFEITIREYLSMKTIRNIMTLGSISYIAITLSGCAMPASGHEFNISALNASATQIYVYRPSQYVNKGLIYYVYLDGKQVGKLRDGGYAIVNTSPGLRAVKVSVDRGFGFGSRLDLQRTVSIASHQKVFLKIATNAGMTGSDVVVTGIGIATSLVTGVGTIAMHNYGSIVTIQPSAASKELLGLRLSS